MSRIPSFKNLEVWKKAMDLVEHVYKVTAPYPMDERFGLVTETRKTARSVVANIAEGKMRMSSKDFRKFVFIALGSLCELHTQMLLARRLGYLPDMPSEKIEGEIEEVGRMLRGLEQALAIA